MNHQADEERHISRCYWCHELDYLTGNHCERCNEKIDEIVLSATEKVRLAVFSIMSEDARMAKFKAQDFQDGYDLALSDIRKAISKETGEVE